MKRVWFGLVAAAALICVPSAVQAGDWGHSHRDHHRDYYGHSHRDHHRGYYRGYSGGYYAPPRVVYPQPYPVYPQPYYGGSSFQYSSPRFSIGVGGF